jgi:hypothetical protein
MGELPSRPTHPPLRTARTSNPVPVTRSFVREAWRGVERVLKEHYHQPDVQAARAIYSAVAAHMLAGPAVWPMIVGPPGSMKTELLNALDGLPSVHTVDQISPNTFISGQIEDPRRKSAIPPGLLHRIGPSAILICPDFSTILSINRNHRGSILSDLRRIYDGHLRKEYGTAPGKAQSREWTGRITFSCRCHTGCRSALWRVPIPWGTLRNGEMAAPWRDRGRATSNESGYS